MFSNTLCVIEYENCFRTAIYESITKIIGWWFLYRQNQSCNLYLSGVCFLYHLQLIIWRTIHCQHFDIFTWYLVQIICRLKAIWWGKHIQIIFFRCCFNIGQNEYSLWVRYKWDWFLWYYISCYPEIRKVSTVFHPILSRMVSFCWCYCLFFCWRHSCFGCFACCFVGTSCQHLME